MKCMNFECFNSPGTPSWKHWLDGSWDDHHFSKHFLHVERMELHFRRTIDISIKITSFHFSGHNQRMRLFFSICFLGFSPLNRFKMMNEKNSCQDVMIGWFSWIINEWYNSLEHMIMPEKYENIKLNYDLRKQNISIIHQWQHIYRRLHLIPFNGDESQRIIPQM